MSPAETNGHHVLSNGHHPPIETREQAMGVALVLVKEHGYTVRQLSDELTARGWKVGKTQAAELVKEARKAEPFLDLLDREEARRDQADRLHTYYRLLVEELRGGRITGRELVGDMRWIEERWAKLAGLDAPKQIEMEVREEPPTMDPEYLAALRAARDQAKRMAVIEAEDGLHDPGR